MKYYVLQYHEPKHEKKYFMVSETGNKVLDTTGKLEKLLIHAREKGISKSEIKFEMSKEVQEKMKKNLVTFKYITSIDKNQISQLDRLMQKLSIE